MIAVIQRVRSASVTDQATRRSARIGPGYLVLLGVTHSDTPAIATRLAQKTTRLRLMADPQGKMNLSLAQVNGELLVVSQFTLLADSSAGHRPSFLAAAPPDQAQALYEHYVTTCRSTGLTVQTGFFGQPMSVKLDNDGPVTIILDSASL